MKSTWLRPFTVLSIVMILMVSLDADEYDYDIIYSKTFKVTKCDQNVNYPVKLKNFVVMPDPIRAPGKMILSMTLDVTEAVLAPISLDMVTQKEITGRWVTIPCIYQFFGSCRYDNLCQMFENAPPCPAELQMRVPFPCKCPIEPNTYEINAKEISLPSNGPFVVGRYHTRILANNWMLGRLMCYHVNYIIVDS